MTGVLEKMKAEDEVNDWDSDDVLSQAVDMMEESYRREQRGTYHVETEDISDVSEDDTYPLTQTRYSQVQADDSDEGFQMMLKSLVDQNVDITDSQVSAVINSVDVSDMLDVGGPCQLGLNKCRRVEETKAGIGVSQIPDSLISKKDQHGPRQAAGKARFIAVKADSYYVKLKPFVPNNTLRKNRWAISTYENGRQELLATSSAENQVPGLIQVLKHNQDLCNMSDTDLSLAISVFVLSLKKENGGEYQGSSLFQMISAIQRHLELNGRRVSFLSDPKFTAVKTALDNAMQSACRKGIGITKTKSDIITIEQEESLWKKGIPGDDEPDKLVKTIFYLIGVHFGIRGGEEQRQLTFSNFKIKMDSHNNRRYLEFTECVSKTYRGGVKHQKIDPHQARAYENVERPGSCPVSLFEKYRGKLHPKANMIQYSISNH